MQSWVIQKLNRMTILVGMVGSDGIVIATDQRRVNFAQSEADLDDLTAGRKITHLEHHSVAYAVAGDMLTDLVGRALNDALDSDTVDFGALDRSLETVISQSMKAHQGENWPDADRSILMAFYGNSVAEPQLWRLTLSWRWPPAHRVDAMAIGGARGNAARCFGYYFVPGRKISDLSLLASHIVLMAGRIDSTMINGLDVALIEKARFRFLATEEKAGLYERSGKLDALIRKQILG